MLCIVIKNFEASLSTMERLIYSDNPVRTIEARCMSFKGQRLMTVKWNNAALQGTRSIYIGRPAARGLVF